KESRFLSPFCFTHSARSRRHHMHQQPAHAPFLPNKVSRSGQRAAVMGRIVNSSWALASCFPAVAREAFIMKSQPRLTENGNQKRKKVHFPCNLAFRARINRVRVPACLAMLRRLWIRSARITEADLDRCDDRYIMF